MKNSKFLIIGIVFGIVLSKSEVVSWYRIYEMFRFQSFHMYGVIGTAVVLGMIFIQIVKRRNYYKKIIHQKNVEPEQRMKKVAFLKTDFALNLEEILPVPQSISEAKNGLTCYH